MRVLLSQIDDLSSIHFDDTQSPYTLARSTVAVHELRGRLLFYSNAFLYFFGCDVFVHYWLDFNIPSTLFCVLPYLSPFSSWLTMYTTVFNCSRGCGPDEEALLPNVEVDVAADLVCHISSEVAADNAVPHTLVLLLERHFHVRSDQL